jgi:hypothetical protein
MEDKIQWCIKQHRNTNHFYDTYLPYEFHLRMVAQVAVDFIHLLESKEKFAHIEIQLACYGHDVIEDCRCSYNDVKEQLGSVAADIVYAVSNEKGKNRKERANEKYYEWNADSSSLKGRILNDAYGTSANFMEVTRSGATVSTVKFMDNGPIVSATQLQLVPSGSAASPYIYWNGDSNTGIYHPSTGNVSVSAQGTQVAFFNTNGISIPQGIRLGITIQGANYSVLSSDYTVLVNAATKTMTLPAASAVFGKVFVVKLIASGTTATVATSGGNIDGSATYTLASQYASIMVQSDGSNYYILSKN